MMIDLMAQGRNVANRLSVEKLPNYINSDNHGHFWDCASADPQYSQSRANLKHSSKEEHQLLLVDGIKLRQEEKLLESPLLSLELTFENKAWVSKQLAFKSSKQRTEILEEYRRRYLLAANDIPEKLSHKKANVGTFAANTWLRELLGLKN